VPQQPPLPVDTIRLQFIAELANRPVVLTAPTGSGKSTQAPRWCAAAGWRVLVVEPRRVACRGLAARVAELEGVKLGTSVGYAVRDDVRMRQDSAMVFATPGVVLRWLADNALANYDVVMLDEFHERSLDVDLLLALLLDRFSGHLVVMSATLDGERVANRVNGIHLKAEGRLFPVNVCYRPGQTFLPDVRGLEERVKDAVHAARDDPGDILVFLPGKGEINRCLDLLKGQRELEALPIHGGLSLSEQSKVFQLGQRRRVILATNVAETSITIPSVGVVIDGGLVRRTRYHNGRGFLTLAPIAKDSAEQRTGRAGRTAPGICYRLWSSEAILTERTPPEIHREALTSLVMGAAACGADVANLPFLDQPKEYAVDAARESLIRLGALADNSTMSDRGHHLFRLPIDPPLAGLLLEARNHHCLPEMIDLVAALSVDRALFASGHRPPEEEHDLRKSGCDAVAAILAVRLGDPARHGLQAYALSEARQARRRLRKLFDCPGRGPDSTHIERRPLVRAALAADPRCVHVARVRKRATAWSNGGTEVQLGRESAVAAGRKDPIIVLESRALGIGARKTTEVITCAMPVLNSWLLDEGVGEGEVTGATVDRGVAHARISHMYAGACLAKREEVPTGTLAQETVRRLFLEGRLWRKEKVFERAQERLKAASTILRLHRSGLVDLPYFDPAELPYEDGVPTIEGFAASLLQTIGLESGRDLPLLSPTDLLPADLPEPVRQWLDRRYPRSVDMGDGIYDVSYDLGQRVVTLTKGQGQRKTPPSLAMLPSWRGFGIRVKHGSKGWVLR
jgi:ATP-dependent helicase HrpB